MNRESSRSHAIFTMNIKSIVRREKRGAELRPRLFDLAMTSTSADKNDVPTTPPPPKIITGVQQRRTEEHPCIATAPYRPGRL